MNSQGQGLMDLGDEFYEALISIHRGLDSEASQALNARLVLLLANEVGDMERLRCIMARASGSELRIEEN